MSNCENSITAVIDSGIGGVAILKELIKRYHSGNYIYYADNLFMPYGNKNGLWLRKRLNYIIELLKNHYHATKIIIACNTASTCLNDLHDDNVIKMNFDISKKYFATKLTKKNLKGFHVIADSSLAKQIEVNIFNDKKLDKIVKNHIKIHKLYEHQEIVLACTHYELVSDKFEKYCPTTKIIKNSSMVIESIKIESNNELNIYVLLSKKNNKFEDTIKQLIRS